MPTLADPPSQEKVQKPAPLSVQQEDVIIHTRITNDEKALRRVTKKFHNYTSVAYDPIVPPSPSTTTSVDDARDAFLVELASFHLSLRKSLMVCEAEARQVEEYQRERERIANEHERTKDQIDELKASLEHAQLERRRKMEYDVIAEKINALPTRDELESSIRALENDMAAIRTEHETQDRTLLAQKTRLDMIIGDLSELRLMGKVDVTDLADNELSRAVSPLPELQVSNSDVEMTDARERAESGELNEEKDDKDSDEEDIPLSKSTSLNPSARAFMPHSSSGTPAPPVSSEQASAPGMSSKEEGEEDEDVEMGELSEDGRDAGKVAKNRKAKEDLEEGEASDLSSELSDPPDD
ncbi:unnamed protein product [Somion occarium]|uniref:Uncharacterized protein n=1 Tax=Somion occarium TaxID=3059160 RepID=A0ABP1CWZ6_9APHY